MLDQKKLSKNDKIIVAVSGGPDSIALLHSLYSNGYTNLYVAHINHGLRGKASDKDERFVKDIAKKMGVAVNSKRVNVSAYAKKNKKTIEDAGREVRYSFFEELAKKINADKIALAHTADDNVETFILRMIRGSGLKGLKGIPPVRGKIVRPFIKTSKKEILLYCKKNKLKFVVDKSNKDNKYSRNLVRNKILPLMRQLNPGLNETIANNIDVISADHTFIENSAKYILPRVVKDVLNDGVFIDNKEFEKLDISLKREVIRNCFEKVNGSTKDLSLRNVDDIIALRSGEIDISASIKCEKNRDVLYIGAKRHKEKVKEFKYRLAMNKSVKIIENGIRLTATIMPKPNTFQKFAFNKAIIDLKKVVGNVLTVRNAVDGDVFVPLGMTGSKKLQDFFVDNKIPVEKRRLIPIITDKEKILWIAGLRIDDRAKVDAGTKKVICLTME